jgi:hypothetical protein
MPSIQTTDTTHRNANCVLVLTSIASVMVALDALVVSTALSTIRLHLHASLAGLEWIVNAYGKDADLQGLLRERRGLIRGSTPHEIEVRR